MDRLTRFSLYDCHLSCITEDGCVAFQFRYSNNLCYLFQDLKGRNATDVDDFASGYAECNHKLRGIHAIKVNVNVTNYFLEYIKSLFILSYHPEYILTFDNCDYFEDSSHEGKFTIE